MASGALPPGFPPIEIDGEYWWDGGLVSNTPLDYVLGEETRRDMLIMQVDLFPARGVLPQSIAAADERAKDIRFSSRTRFTTDQNMRLSAARQAFHRLARHLPDELRATPEFRILDEIAQENAVAIAQLVYRDKAYESGSKDYEFSRGTMLEHWATGRQDAFNAIRDAHWLNEPMKPGITSYDMSGATHEPR